MKTVAHLPNNTVFIFTDEQGAVTVCKKIDDETIALWIASKKEWRETKHYHTDRNVKELNINL